MGRKKPGKDSGFARKTSTYHPSGRKPPRPPPTAQRRASSQPIDGAQALEVRPASFVLRPSAYTCEAEIFPGLEDLAWAEIESHFGRWAQRLPQTTAGRLAFQYFGTPASLLDLKRVVAVHLVLHFPVPRPKALLGHQHFQNLLRGIHNVLDSHPRGIFASFRVSAAGDDSGVFTRLKSEIAEQTGLKSVSEGGDLLIAVRPAAGAEGWEAVIRISPRPLAARAWRVCNLPGALNASIASCMMALTQPTVADRVLNLACGSATLLIERLKLGAAALAVGCDTDADALACASQNLSASRDAPAVTLGQWDARRLPLADASIDVVCADLPFGALVGSHEANAHLYPQIFNEAARVTRPGGRMVVITQEIRLTEGVLEDRRDVWHREQTLRVTLPTNAAPIKPVIYLLRRL